MNDHGEDLAENSAVECTIWASGTPRWLRSALHIWAIIALLTAMKLSRLLADTALAHRLEQLPYSLFWILLVLGTVSLGPYAIMQHGSRRWLRRFYPDVPALYWNAERIKLSDGRVIPWTDVKQVRANRTQANSLEIYTDLWSKNGKIVIHRMLLLDPDETESVLKFQLNKYRNQPKSKKDQSDNPLKQTKAQQNYLEAIGKPTSQLKAEGIPTSDIWAMRSYFMDQAAKNSPAP